MKIKIPSIRLLIAGAIAVVADVIQWVLIPAFAELGFLSPVNDIIDMAVAGIMVWLLGFHWVFVPAALGELVPMANLMPFWSGAVFFVAIGQDALPVNAIGAPGEKVLPGVNPNAQLQPIPSLPTAQAAPLPADEKSLHPYFREIESK